MQTIRCGAGEVRVTRYPPHTFMPRHRHDFDKVSVVLAGSVVERSGASERFVEAGWIVAKPGGVEHEDEVGPRGLCTMTLLATPRDGASQAAWTRLVAEYRWLPLEPSVGRLLRLVGGRVEEPGPVMEEVLFSLASHAARTEQGASGWFGRAVGILRERHDAPPSLVELADEVAVHPVTLSRRLRAAGTSKTELVHRSRIQRALRELHAPGPIAQLAAELGYADGAHFARSFRHWMGCTPRDYRARFSAKR